MQVEKEVVKAIRQMEEVEVEVRKKKEVSGRVKQLRRQVRCLTLAAASMAPVPNLQFIIQNRLSVNVFCVDFACQSCGIRHTFWTWQAELSSYHPMHWV